MIMKNVELTNSILVPAQFLMNFMNNRLNRHDYLSGLSHAGDAVKSHARTAGNFIRGNHGVGQQRRPRASTFLHPWLS